MWSPDTLMTALAPLLRTLHGADPDDPTLGTRLNQAHPMSSDEVAAVRSAVLSGLKDGWLCPKEAGSIRFGRLAKDALAVLFHHGLVIQTRIAHQPSRHVEDRPFQSPRCFRTDADRHESLLM